jgi:siderophore synthetase component
VLFGETNKLHEAFAKDLTALIAEVAEFKEKVKKNPHELKKFLVDKMRPLEDELMLGEDNQKHENKSAQEIITEIKRENKETSEAIVKTFEKVSSTPLSSNTSKSKLGSTTDDSDRNPFHLNSHLLECRPFHSVFSPCSVWICGIVFYYWWRE